MIINPEMVISIQAFRNYLCFKYMKDIRLYITSACRCPEHNKEVGGVDNSQHISTEKHPCEAMDFWSADLPTQVLYDEAKTCGLFSTVIYYIKSKFIHGDIRMRTEVRSWSWNK